MLLATCATNDIVNYVLPFIQKSISSANWKERDAAVMAFGMMKIFNVAALFAHKFVYLACESGSQGNTFS